MIVSSSFFFETSSINNLDLKTKTRFIYPEYPIENDDDRKQLSNDYDFYCFFFFLQSFIAIDCVCFWFIQHMLIDQWWSNDQKHSVFKYTFFKLFIQSDQVDHQDIQ